MIKIHLAIGEYEFVEFETERLDNSAMDNVRAIREAFKPKVGLPSKEFNEFIDRQLNGEPNNIEDYNQMNAGQQDVAQHIKKALARISYKQNKNEN